MIELKHIKDAEVVERWVSINPEALQEIREILEGIRSGQLMHDQRRYHTQTECGTAHCIAGWKAHNDAIKAGLSLLYDEDEDEDEGETFSAELDMFMRDKSFTMCEWLYVQKQWGLTVDESVALFDSEATLAEQFELLTVLESGYTIERQ